MVFGLWKEWLTADLVSLGIGLGIASIGTVEASASENTLPYASLGLRPQAKYSRTSLSRMTQIQRICTGQ